MDNQTVANHMSDQEYIIRSIARKYYQAGMEDEDILGEANVAAVMAIRSWDESKGASLATYLSRCVHNALKNLLTKATMACRGAKYETVSYDAWVGSDDEREMDCKMAFADPRMDVENDVVSRVWMEQMMDRVFSHLGDPLYRQMFQRHIDGYTQREIAEQYGITQQAVCQKLKRIQTHIRKQMAEEEQ